MTHFEVTQLKITQKTQKKLCCTKIFARPAGAGAGNAASPTCVGQPDMNPADDMTRPNTKHGSQPQDLQDTSLLSLDPSPRKMRTKNYGMIERHTKTQEHSRILMISPIV